MEIERPKSKQPIPPHAKRVFKGVIFDVYQWEQEMYDGTKAIFEKVKRPDTVLVFPVLPDGKILLTLQEQPGAGGPFVSGAGGRVDEGEDVLTASKRELLEETGYEAEKFILLDAAQPSGKVEGAMYIFVAKGLKKVADMDLDAGEKIKLFSITFDEFIELGTNRTKNFDEKEMALKLFEAKLDPKKRAELENLFKPE